MPCSESILDNPLLFLILGALFGVLLLFISGFLPLIEIIIGSFSLIPAGSGTRLYVFGLHIHHYMIGIVLLIVDELPALASGGMEPFATEVLR